MGIKGKGRWPDIESWKSYGVERGYNERNPSSLYLSSNSDEKSWYGSGNRQRWLSGFEFKKKRPEPRFTTFKQWKQYGIEMGYNNKNAASVDENPEGKHWYYRGSVKGWLQKFRFNRKLETSGLVFNDSDEWKQYGVKTGYVGRTPTSLSNSSDIKERAWYQKGQKNDWLEEFEFKRKGTGLDTLKSWKQYGIEQGYNSRNSKSISKSTNDDERSWYIKGAQEKWLRNFKFQRIKGGNKPVFREFEPWQQEGMRRGYNQKNSTSLADSEDKEERSWYCRGARMKWLGKFGFSRKINNSGRSNLQFNTYKEWASYGLAHKYDGRISAHLIKSSSIKDRSWHAKGNSEGWLKQFPFENRKQKSTLEFKDFKSWEEHGIKAGFDKLNPISVSQSKDVDDRRWYKIGYSRGWGKQFDFKVKKRTSPWKNEDEWRKWGIEQGFEKISPISLIKSDDDLHNFWYGKGQREGWVKAFNFTRHNETPPYKNFEEWKAYGLAHEFDQRNSSSLFNSTDKSERAWYSKGGSNKWITRFSFSPLENKLEIDSLGSLLEQYAGDNS